MEDVSLQSPDKTHSVGYAARKIDAVKKIGRSTCKYQFTIRCHSTSGLPELPKCSGLSLQLSRGRAKTFSTKAAPVSKGSVSWDGEILAVNATLRESKTGKGHSDKVYKISLVGIFEKRLRELARSEINLSAFTTASMPVAHSVSLSPRKQMMGGSKSQPLLQVEIGAMESNIGDEDSDDGDSVSASSAASGNTWMSASIASELEQDLGGFDSTRPTAALSAIGEDRSVRFASVKTDVAASGTTSAEGEIATPVAAPAGLSPLREESPTPGSSERQAQGTAGSNDTPGESEDGGGADASLAGLCDTPSCQSQAASESRLAAPDHAASVSGGGDGVLIKGWLSKQAVSAPPFLKNWKMRYIVLSSSAVSWHKQEGAEAAGAIRLTDQTKVRSSSGHEVRCAALRPLAIQLLVTQLRDPSPS